MGNGPKSWSAAKRRMKRPETNAAIKNHEQNVGRLPRQTVSRAVQPAPMLIAKKKKGAAPLQTNEKRLRSLNKLLRDIEALQAKEAAGEELDDQQIAKVDRLDDVLAEMEELMGGG